MENCEPCVVCGEPACGCKLCDKQHYCAKHLPRESTTTIYFGAESDRKSEATYGDYTNDVAC